MDQDFWPLLTLQIRNREVVPIIGPELVKITPPGGGEAVLFTEWLAGETAKALQLKPEMGPYPDFNAVAKGFVTTNERASPSRIQAAARAVAKGKSFEPCEDLKLLAGISGFDVFLTTTYDNCLQLALEQERGANVKVAAYDPKRPESLPAARGRTVLYHLLGTLKGRGDLGLWDEDHIRFVRSLQEHKSDLTRLFEALQMKDLLFIGAGLNDWVERFFMHVARQSDFTSGDLGSIYATGLDPERENSLVFFFEKLTRVSTIIGADVSAFVKDLRRHWDASCQELGPLPEPVATGEEPSPSDRYVFISYAHDDFKAADEIRNMLEKEDLRVWMDRKRLRAGQNYECELEHAVRDRKLCRVFLSVVSAETEGREEGYVHKERRWAAERAKEFGAGAGVFYIPIVIDDSKLPLEMEPKIFEKIHVERCSDGVLDDLVIDTIRNRLAYDGNDN